MQSEGTRATRRPSRKRSRRPSPTLTGDAQQIRSPRTARSSKEDTTITVTGCPKAKAAKKGKHHKGKGGKKKD